MANKAQWPPRVHRHASGQARVRVKGIDYYLGLFGTSQAAKRYAELIETLTQDGPAAPPRPRRLTVSEALDRYDEHARGHYRKPSGEPTSELSYIRRAGDLLRASHGETAADAFRGRALKEVRENMVRLGWCRSNINHHVRIVKRIWRWLASEELISAETCQSVWAVEPLKAGRTVARESDPVQPAKVADVLASLPYLTPHLADAVRLQLATACRPGEVLACRPSEIERAGGVWLWRPAEHKTAYRGRQRTILIGPEGQAIVTRLMVGRDGEDYYLFCPRQSEAARRALVRSRSRTPRPTPLTDKYLLADRFDGIGYAKAIRRACRRAGVPPYSPNRLRHAAATALAAQFGPLVAQTILGHSALRTTEIYAQRDLTAAMDAIRKVG